MTMTQAESVALVRQILSARDDDELTQIVGLNLGRIDGTFFGVLEASAKQLERENKPNIANALRAIGDRMLRMKTLI
jgi:endonuclease III